MRKKILFEYTKNIWNNHTETIAKWGSKGFILLILAICVTHSGEILQAITAFVVRLLVWFWNYASWLLG